MPKVYRYAPALAGVKKLLISDHRWIRESEVVDIVNAPKAQLWATLNVAKIRDS